MLEFIQFGRNFFDLVANKGGIALLGILGIEEAGVPLPIPGDLLLVFAGFQISSSNLEISTAYLSSIVGVVVGSSLLFFLGKFGGRPLVIKYGKYILLPHSRLEKIESWFLKRGKKAVVIGRFVPGLRVFISAVAGILELKYAYFLPQILVASTIWILAFIGLGYALGEKWHNLAATTQKYGFIFFFPFILILGLYILKNKKEHKEKVN